MQSVFTLSGEIDSATQTANRHAAENFWSSAGGQEWVVDLAAVSFMDSAGLGLLVEVLAKARNRGASLTLCAPSPALLSLLTITGLVQVFDLQAAAPESSFGI